LKFQVCLIFHNKVSQRKSIDKTELIFSEFLKDLNATWSNTFQWFISLETFFDFQLASIEKFIISFKCRNNFFVENQFKKVFNVKCLWVDPFQRNHGRLFYDYKLKIVNAKDHKDHILQNMLSLNNIYVCIYIRVSKLTYIFGSFTNLNKCVLFKCFRS
jgi:hypothetical protein